MTIKDKLKENDIDTVKHKEIVDQIKNELKNKGESGDKITDKLSSEGEKIVDDVISNYKKNKTYKSTISRPTTIRREHIKDENNQTSDNVKIDAIERINNLPNTYNNVKLTRHVHCAIIKDIKIINTIKGKEVIGMCYHVDVELTDKEGVKNIRRMIIRSDENSIIDTQLEDMDEKCFEIAVKQVFEELYLHNKKLSLINTKTEINGKMIPHWEFDKEDINTKKIIDKINEEILNKYRLLFDNKNINNQLLINGEEISEEFNKDIKIQENSNTAGVGTICERNNSDKPINDLENKYDGIYCGFKDDITKVDNEFSKDLANFLGNIQTVASYDISKIDDYDYRNEINEDLKEIKDFIYKYNDNYYQIGLIEGFKEAGNIDGQDYYYYIADQHCKANVYYIRYINFLEDFNCNDEECQNEIEDSKKNINNIIKNFTKDAFKTNDIVSCNISNISDYIDKVQDFIDQNNPLKNKELNDLDEVSKKIKDIELIELEISKILKNVENIKANNDISYKVYMLFNNMMREIRYYGAAYQYLWHWDKKSKNLFRYSKNGNEQNRNEEQFNNVKSFMQNMFNSVVDHVNKPNNGLYSYSENPFIDIYKYVRIEKCNEYNVLNEDNEIKIEVKGLNNTNKSIFEIINKTSVNIIKCYDEIKNFYEFIQNNNSKEIIEDSTFSVELYPRLNVEKNEKDTPINIKSLFYNYLVSWDDETKHIMSYIADDKEVVTSGDINDEEIIVNDKNTESLKPYKENCKFIISFEKKDELIYLIIKLFGYEKEIESIVKKIKFEYHTNYPNWSLEKDIENAREAKKNEVTIEYHICISEKEYLSLLITIKDINSYYNSKNESIDIGDINKTIIKKLQESFKYRYNTIIKNSGNYKKANFVLDYIKSCDEFFDKKKNKYLIPLYLHTYNEYKGKDEKVDEEISMIKNIIIKQLGAK